jgi:O-succinylbenzoate synthase
MTVKELIESLSKIEDQEVRVMVNGYEGGVDDIVIGNSIDNTPAIIHVALDVNREWYYGKHERVDNLYDVPNDRYHIVKAIIL